jgi:hypothetical protein
LLGRAFYHIDSNAQRYCHTPVVALADKRAISVRNPKRNLRTILFDEIWMLLAGHCGPTATNIGVTDDFARFVRF